jgi:hypothetical protein
MHLYLLTQSRRYAAALPAISGVRWASAIRLFAAMQHEE